MTVESGCNTSLMLWHISRDAKLWHRKYDRCREAFEYAVERGSAEDAGIELAGLHFAILDRNRVTRDYLLEQYVDYLEIYDDVARLVLEG